MPKIMFMTVHDAVVENIYTQIKDSLKAGEISVEDVEAIAELTTELAARTKEENGKQEG